MKMTLLLILAVPIQFLKKNWDEREFQIARSKMPATSTLQKDPGGKFKQLRATEVLNYLKETWPDITKFSFDYRGVRDFKEELPAPRWKEHSEKVANQFAVLGFQVKKVKHPSPFLSTTLENYTDRSGKIVFQNLIAKLVFPSYTNSLVLNANAYIPQYEKMLSVLQITSISSLKPQFVLCSRAAKMNVKFLFSLLD